MANHNAHFYFDEQSQENAKIKVIGVGGGGGNAINNMIEKGLGSVEYIALNTDSQALKNSMADIKIQVGTSLTNGLGAGARPEVGREAIEENRHEIEEAIESADMIFVTAGMGGGTGTGGAPVVAGMAKRKGILTVGIVTTPFECEGKPRMRYALEGVNELKKNCDTVIVIPNQRLTDITDESTSLIEAFELANEVLYNATRGISDLILMPGLINLDFADVRTTMSDGGAAIMGSSSATGPERAELAARSAINSPLLDGVSIRGARSVLVNISASSSLGMRETTMATSIVQQEAGDNAEIIWGTVIDESFGDELRITVIATGFELAEDRSRVKIASNERTPASVADRLASRIQERMQESGVPARLERGTTEYWKGDENLRGLDVPSIQRRELRARNHSAEQKELPDEVYGQDTEENVNREEARTIPFKNTYERPAAEGSEQPAFLRKIMD